jgi:ABC-type sugar transport system substrate-binding protein
MVYPRTKLLLVLVLVMGTVVFAQEKEAGELYFRFVTHGGDDPFWAVVVKGAQDAAKLLNCKVDFDLVGGDLALQQKRMQEAVAMNVDGIALVINDDTVWDKLVEEALAKNIPVVAIDNDDTEGDRGNSRLTYIGQDELKAGYDLAMRLFEEGKNKWIN